MPFFLPASPDAQATPLPRPDPGWLFFLENAPAMVWLGDRRGRLVHVNSTWRKATGADIADYPDEAIWRLVHPDDRQRLADLAGSFNAAPVSYEFRQKNAGGGYRWVVERLRPWMDPTGRFIGYIGNTVDIQSQKDQERYLTVLAMRQTSLTHFSRMVLESAEPDKMNAEAVRLFCEHLSLPAGVLLTRASVDEPLAATATVGLPPGVELEFNGLPPDGNTVDYPDDRDSFPLSAAWMEARGWTEGVALPVDPQLPGTGWLVGLRARPGEPPIGPLNYARDLLGILAIAHTRHRAQAQLRESEERALLIQKMDAVGMLAGGVAHDFNNLLTAIRCFAELLLDDLAEPKQRSKVDDILHATSRASHLVKQLLTFSRMDVSQPEPTELNAMLDGLRGFIRSVLSEHVRIDMHLGGEPAWCMVDGKQLEQVIFNLCLNARDVMPSDGVLTLSVTCVEPAGTGQRRVRLSVADTGGGIPEAVQAKLFQPFHTTKAPGRGTGLGLASSQGIVRAFGGELTYETKIGQGTVFHIELPEITDPLAEVVETGGDVAAKSAPTVRILLVEDDELVRAVTGMMAQSIGHEVTVYGDGLEALEWATRTGLAEIDLLVTDIVMPGINGHELAQRLRAIKPSLKLLFMSGYVADQATMVALQQPDVFFLPKPFTSAGFIEKLHEAIGG
jgi:two-component system, cell cycle sensor histidine kinase and response regulator CckA